ncbi:MAG: hypothetical protein LBT92_00610 [Rickettsiales bacterium]|jgi:hypothetical protein|nr:hypothetical protein [Rickettsiales bacterium]
MNYENVVGYKLGRMTVDQQSRLGEELRKIHSASASEEAVHTVEIALTLGIEARLVSR